MLSFVPQLNLQTPNSKGFCLYPPLEDLVPSKLAIIANSKSKNRFPKTADSNPQTIGTDAKMLILVTFHSMLLKVKNMV